MTLPASPIQGIALLMAATMCFAAYDATSKVLMTLISPFVALWFRFFFQMASTVIVILPRQGGAMFRTRRPGLQLLRGLALAFMSLAMLTSLRYMPLGELTSIMMMTPVIMTVVMALRPGARISAVNWVLLFVAFVGAILIAGPSGDLGPPGMLWIPLVGLICNGVFQLVTAELAGVDPPATTHCYTSVVGLGVATLLLPFFWELPRQLEVWLLLLPFCIFSNVGHFLLIQAYQRASAAVLAPFLYMQLLFATLLGWLVFEHAPVAWALAGIGLIAVAGVANAWLAGRRRARQGT